MRHVFLALLAGCGPATAGIPDGSASSLQTPGATNGTPGDTDDPGGVVWVDAVGMEVEGVVEIPEGLAYADEDGYFWAFEPVATDAAAAFRGFSQADFFYGDDDCSAPVAVGDILPPRLAMLVEGERFIAMQDDGEATRPGGYFGLSGGDCVWIDDFLSSTLSSDHIIEITRPPLYWTPPLHLETF